MARKKEIEGRSKLTKAQLEQRRQAGRSRAKQLGTEGLSQLGTMGYEALKAKIGPTKALGILAEAKKSSPTRPEQWLYKTLRELNVPFGCQIIFEDRYILDACNLEAGWIIEIDGFRYKQTPFGRNGESEMEKLQAKLEYLRSLGYRTLYLSWADSNQINQHKLEDFLGELHEKQNSMVQLPWAVRSELAF